MNIKAKSTMKYIYIVAVFILTLVSLNGQNITRANHVGPWGVQVNTYNGNLYLDRTDLFIPNEGLSIDISFAYNSQLDTLDFGYGKGWTFSYGMRYDEVVADTFTILFPDGRSQFHYKSGSSFVTQKGFFDSFVEYESGKFLLETKSGMKYYFEDPIHQSITKIEDTNGNTISLAYTAGQLATITDQSSRSVQLSWSDNHLTQISDDNSSSGLRTLAYTYDADDRMISFKDLMDQNILYDYRENNLINITDQRGEELVVNHDANGRIVSLVTCIAKHEIVYNEESNKTYVSESNSDGDRLTTYEYSENGSLERKTGSCCGFNTTYEYDEDNNIVGITDANGNQYRSNHDQLGNAVASQDPQGASRSYEYSDALNRLTQVTDKRGASTSFQYNTNGDITSLTQADGAETRMQYDAKGNVTNIEDANDNMMSMSYNSNNDLSLVSYPIGSESFEYDNAGNLLEMTDGNTNKTMYSYDKLNRITSVQDNLNIRLEFDYDNASNLISEKDGNGVTRRFDYDTHSRLIEVETPLGITKYNYDSSGNLISILDANEHLTTYTYNSRDLLTSETDAEGNTTLYAYDGNGNVTQKIDANFKVCSYTYDNLNRLTRKSYEGNTDSYEYDVNNNIIACANKDVRMVFTYDVLNRLKTKTMVGWDNTISYDYDGVGNRTSMTDKTGETTYLYDGNNRLMQLTNPQGDTFEFAYDVGGRMISQTNSNGTISAYTYDAANRLISLTNSSGSTIISSYTYEYDNNGNRTKMTTQDGSVTYEYDEDNRLLSADYNDIDLLDESYTLDHTGNRMSLSQGTETTTYTYDAADRLLSAGSINYSFDNSGNLVAMINGSEATEYTYNGEHRLTDVKLPNGKVVEYTYDPFGNRLSKSIDGEVTRYVLDGDNILFELDINNTVSKRYTTALSIDSWLSFDFNGTNYTYHKDGLGSITGYSNQSGALQREYLYDSYGNMKDYEEGDINVITYTGREWGLQVQSYHLRSRNYEPTNGRFLSKDTLMFRIKNPNTLNRYLYVHGNPINYIDFDGYEPLTLLLTGLAIYNVIDLGYRLTANYIEHGSQVWCYKFKPTDFFPGVLKAAEKIAKLKQLRNAQKILSKDIKRLQKKYMASAYKLSGYDGRIAKEINRLQKIEEAYKQSEKSDFGLLNGLVDFFDGFIPPYFTEEFSLVDCNNTVGNQSEFVGPLPPGVNLPLPELRIIEIDIIRSQDPNEIISPTGCGYQKWVAGSSNIPYTILFENDPDFATAAAQTVSIRHKFDDDINPFSFRLSDFGFGPYYFEVPDNTTFYSTQIDLPDSVGVDLNVLAGFDINTNEAFWILESVDPSTGLASSLSAEAGFLPVNDTLSGTGEGFVNFRVLPNTFAETGDTIFAVADIVFDDNLPITTNIEHNFIDANPPVSHLDMVDNDNGSYDLSWFGSDIGSGVVNYTLYYSVDGGTYLPIDDDISDNTYSFVGDPSSTYSFITIAEDCAGNVEEAKPNGDVCALIIIDTIFVIPTLGNSDGSIELIIGNAFGEVDFQWESDISDSAIASNLSTGLYVVNITDEVGCFIQAEIQLDSIATSISEPQTDSDLFILSLFPNPSSDILNIEYANKSEFVEYRIIRMDGTFVTSGKLNSYNHSIISQQLNISNLIPGQYILSLMDDSNKIINASFIKM